MTIHQQRRVVTGVTPDGTSVFVEDGTPPRVLTFEAFPGDENFTIWATDEPPTLPSDGSDPTMALESFSPPVFGTRFMINRWPAGTSDGHGNMRAEEMPGIAETLEANSGMHTTDTIDYGVVISGEISCELDDGATVTLRAGDCIVQNGTRHAWRNDGPEPCVMAFVMVGGRRTAP